ncbi:hypothetical protein DTO164E3_4625 [Paecilomyces variotii]|nr:hypothetical protein DTO164E3_4625 [Paecilomyces variotii]KAJ9204477.1 hypothetical protein DTO032I3_2732 [Paecilomyces variotii]KAJ9278267.1 hypothetical protein DTO021D3_4746 [Paecilomyces variotii]KAJ9344445.1 hypothetical protein DTO027B6_3063 [Paecilomyces variotii]KAJ9349886.1 hypothetical protein DTO027B9_7338 [Paecilomyces variotii]
MVGWLIKRLQLREIAAMLNQTSQEALRLGAGEVCFPSNDDYHLPELITITASPGALGLSSDKYSGWIVEPQDGVPTAAPEKTEGARRMSSTGLTSPSRSAIIMQNTPEQTSE